MLSVVMTSSLTFSFQACWERVAVSSNKVFARRCSES